MRKVIVIGLASAISCSAMAAASTNGMYLKAFGGVGLGSASGLNAVEPGKPSVASGIETTDKSTLYGIAAGYSLSNSPISIELQAMRLNKQSFKISNLYPSSYHEIDTLNVRSNIYLLNGIYSFPMTHCFTPFIGAGVGVAQNKVSGNFVGSKDSSWNRYWPSAGRTNFAYGMMAGLNYEINDHFSTALTYQYVSLGKLNNDRVVDRHGSSFDQSISANHFGSNNIMLSVTYKL